MMAMLRCGCTGAGVDSFSSYHFTPPIRYKKSKDVHVVNLNNTELVRRFADYSKSRATSNNLAGLAHGQYAPG